MEAIPPTTQEHGHTPEVTITNYQMPGEMSTGSPVMPVDLNMSAVEMNACPIPALGQEEQPSTAQPHAVHATHPVEFSLGMTVESNSPPLDVNISSSEPAFAVKTEGMNTTNVPTCADTAYTVEATPLTAQEPGHTSLGAPVVTIAMEEAQLPAAGVSPNIVVECSIPSVQTGTSALPMVEEGETTITGAIVQEDTIHVETQCTMLDTLVVSGLPEGLVGEVQLSTPTELSVEKMSPSVSVEVQPQMQPSLVEAESSTCEVSQSAASNVTSADLVVETCEVSQNASSPSADLVAESTTTAAQSSTSAEVSGSAADNPVQEKSKHLYRAGTRSLARSGTSSLAKAQAARREKRALKPVVERVMKTLNPENAKESRLGRAGFGFGD